MHRQQEILSYLKKEFENHQKPEKEYADIIIPQINKVSWSTETQYHLELLKVERSWIPKGRILKAEPNEKRNCVKTAFDIHSRIIYEERWEVHPSHGYKKYFIYELDKIYAYKFNRTGEIDEIEYQEKQNELPVYYGGYAERKANTFDSYEYTNGKLSKITSMVVYDENDIQYPSYIINYDKLGNLNSVTRIDEPSKTFPEGQNIVVYKKTPYTLKALLNFMVEGYVNFLLQRIQKQGEKKILLIAIEGAFLSDTWLPPKYCVLPFNGQLDESQKLNSFIDFDTVHFEQHPANGDALFEVSNLLQQEITLKEKYDSPDDILLDIAMELKSKLNSSEILILPLNLPDDYYKEVGSLLRGIYSKRELMKLMQG